LKIADMACVMSAGLVRLTTSAQDPARHDDIVQAMLGDHREPLT
jgi:hypothetical protein